jgi:pyridoxal phosphate enzyme (YggS family)
VARAAEEVLTLAERLSAVHTRVAGAAAAAGREATEIKLVAVSKSQPAEAIRRAHDAGQRAFGESYAQELALKAEALTDLVDIEWHFIGHLQTNKAKIVAKHADVVHSVDSEALARELAKRAARERRSGLPVFIEVNVAREPQKAGAMPSEIEDVIRAVRAEASLILRGLMTVPPAGDPAAARSVFGALATLRNLHGGPAALPELSMGMSADFEGAIACGSTCVRIGTAIFGER